MSLLSNFFIVDKNIMLEHCCGADFPITDRCQFKSLTSLEIAGIYAVLKGGSDTLELLDEFLPVIFEDSEEFVETVPDELVRLLASIEDNDIKSIAEKCAVETEEEIAWEASDFEPLLNELRQLSLSALKHSKRMYFWNSL